jgi:hypothetical protein
MRQPWLLRFSYYVFAGGGHRDYIFAWPRPDDGTGYAFATLQTLVFDPHNLFAIFPSDRQLKPLQSWIVHLAQPQI